LLTKIIKILIFRIKNISTEENIIAFNIIKKLIVIIIKNISILKSYVQRFFEA